MYLTFFTQVASATLMLSKIRTLESEIKKKVLVEEVLPKKKD